MAEIPQYDFGGRIISDATVTYKVVQKLGAGGNAHVYLVQATNGEHRGMLFALKLFVKIEDATRGERFKQEVEFLKQCSHPAIMRVYDQGHVPMADGDKTVKYPFVIADYLPKRLRDSMREGLSIAEKATFVSQMLSGLAYLDSRKEGTIIHRDIKPENIFVRGRSCILGDFGLMKVLKGPDIGDEKKFFIESVGPRLPFFYRTPDLVAYCREGKGLSSKSDVFQLGLVAAELFSGINPLKKAWKILDPVHLNDLEIMSGSQTGAISSEISRMLEMDEKKRPNAHDLYDKWEGIFFEIVRMSHSLEGRVF